MTRFIYLDHHATTPCDPRVLEAMLPWFVDAYGNPGSSHYLQGAGARDAVARARIQVAELLSANPSEVVFTAGATEAINLGLKGLMESAGPGPHRIITTTIEHDAVLQTCSVLERAGAEIVHLPVDQDGLVDPEAVRAAITPTTLAVAIMAANNEIGTVQPVADIGRLCREAGVVYMADIAQSLGKIPMALGELGVDLAAMSAHKLYG
ncbi:MAG: aminotransferase class V-fold PLP-dependent enzyme, partial [Myxococcota bacterium]|nr:aminotransferase class V-fold PLP-dependent enzyme [Myxococcota bacterium]